MRNTLKSLFVTCSLLVFTWSAHASVAVISDGTYQTLGESHYKDNQFTLKSWGDGFAMNAVLEKDGREFEVEAFLRPVRNNEYSGSGTIIVRYENGGVCRHKFGTKFFVTSEGLFLRENTPRFVPYNPMGACAAAGPYIWFNHAAPYSLEY